MKIRLSFIIGVIILLNVGCGSKNAIHKHIELEEQSEDSITFMIKVMGDKKTPLEKLIEDYNKTSDVKINIKKVAYDEYQYVLNMKMLSHDKPDIFMLEKDWVDTYVEKDWLLPIDIYMDKQFNKPYNYVLPLGMSTYRLVYNKDIFREVGLDPEKPPKTLEELYEYAIFISKMKIGDSYGFALYLKDEESGFMSLLEDVNKMIGRDYYNHHQNKYDFTIYKDWFEKMIKIRQESGTLEYAMELKKDSVMKQFSESNIGMMIISNEDYFWLASQEDMNIGISQVPILSQEDIADDNISIPGMLIGINKESEHGEDILKLCNKLTSKEWGTYMYEEGYIMPTYNMKLEELHSFEDVKTPKEFLPEKEMLFDECHILDNEQERIRFNIYHEILKGERTVDEGLADITNMLNEIALTK
ncbi:ABC transporter substrate-binding protein [Vallitalea maricola]|uniref:Uncharacterized protein n=1 Tax=Vallitalea maricola TaxID=3074433 RepID=A0ACB5UFH0_9FIRM|nr:hypothetical protein AN2V17_05730 [Vallitalea sp. AN17-2]